MLVGDPILLLDQQKQAFRRIRNYLAGRLLGVTRDSALMHELVKCLFCRVRLNGLAQAYAGVDPLQVAKLYRNTFAQLRKELPSVFERDEEILMDPVSLTYVDGELSQLNLYEPTRDPLGDIYEAFVGTSIQQDQGQFFTPQNAIAWLVEAVNPQPGETVIDPACGAGGFLSYTARRLKNLGVRAANIAACLHGIEKDRYLAKLAQAHIAVTTLLQSRITCGDSIAWTDVAAKPLQLKRAEGFDVVLTNPPFGARIISASDEVRRTYALAHAWKKDRSTDAWVQTTRLQKATPPQVLFLERCIELLKPSGRLGIVIPESLVSGNNYAFVVEYLLRTCNVEAIVGMPETLFKTSGKGGTHTKTCLIVARKKYKKSKAPSIFMAEAKWCGHDSRGRTITTDDLPVILDNFQRRARLKEQSHLGYLVQLADLRTNNLAPRYHDPESTSELEGLRKTHDLVSVGQLVEREVLEFSTGDEIGKLSYGTGDIPFVRTSDISNWEIKADPKHCVSEQVYERYRQQQDVRRGDILMVRDGTYLIGSCAFVSEYDERIIFQSHLYKIRVKKPEVVSPYLLLALLSCDPVLKQIKAKRVTQDIIDSLGDRVFELLLPIPKSKDVQARIAGMVESSIRDRIEARELARLAKRGVVAFDAQDEKLRALSSPARSSKGRSQKAYEGATKGGRSGKADQ
jgi:type I restriction enzyme M protein